MVEQRHLVFAGVAVVATAACLFLFLKIQPKQEAKSTQKKRNSKKQKKQASSPSATTPKKKKEDKTPKPVDPGTLKDKYAIGDIVEVNGGTRGWIKGEVTGPPLASKSGVVLYMVRRASSRPDPNNTGKKTNSFSSHG